MILVPKHWNSMFHAILLGASLCCAAEEIRVGTAENGAWLDTGTSDSCHVTVREKWSRFAVVDFDENGQKSHFLIRQDFEVGQGCFEGHNPQSVTLSAFPVDTVSGKAGEKPVWQTSTAGVDGQFLYYRDLYGVKVPGCCGALDTTLYYSLRNGKFAGASTSRLLEIEVANTPFQRFISTQTDWASEWRGLKGAQVNLFYASKYGLIQSVGVILPEGFDEGPKAHDLYFSGKKKEDAECSLFDVKTIAGNAVVLESTLVVPFKITLPFTDDGFDISQARMEGVEAKLVTETYPAAQDGTKEETKQDNH